MAVAADGAGSGDKRPSILITGATGLIGRELMRELSPNRWRVRGLSGRRNRPQDKEIQGDFVSCDLTADGKAQQVVEEFRPTVVVHLAAERRPDAVAKDPERARKLNVDVVQYLADACDRTQALLLFVSTDYVFDGTSPPYTVESTPNPLNGYGKQKYEGEKIAEKTTNWAVLRVPLLYGKVEFLSESSVTDLYDKLRQGQLKEADSLQKRYPTHCGDVAKVLRAMIELHCSGRAISGYFHWQANQCLTKYDMLRIIGDVAGLATDEITASTVVPKAARPENSMLDCSRLEQLLDDPSKYRRDFREGLRDGLRFWIGTAKCTRVLQDINGGRELKLSRSQIQALLLNLTPGLSEADTVKIMDAAAVDEKHGIPWEAFVQWIFQ
mmetsp:Transcript_44793/g.106324  ORF Transcript_44793/g.106324 Transcript_44793/m.106324 type:complete len:383 (-) Transcript_44793:164-1312(-)